MCPSSGEIIVSMRHFVFVTLCGWLHARKSSTQSDKYKVSHRYSCFSWWWAHSRPRHVEKRNKHTKKNCAPSWLYLQDYTGTHGQQNVTKHKEIRSLFTPIAVRTQQALNKLSKLYIHDTNKCTFYVYKYNVISLLHVSTSRHPRRTETCSRYIRLYLYIYKRCICWCHEWTF